MSVELKIPPAGESIAEVILSEWVKNEGAWVEEDETVAVLETDKANVEVTAPSSGRVERILKKEGETAEIGEIIAYIDEKADRPKDGEGAPPKNEQPASAATAPAEVAADTERPHPSSLPRATPTARRALRGAGIDVYDIDPGPDGVISKKEVDAYLSRPAQPAQSKARPKPKAPSTPMLDPAGREEEAVTMTPIRKRIAARLVQAQQNAAILSTFNEVDMTEVIALRKAHQDSFVKKHGTKLGFMSFFVKACIEGLKAFPSINAEIREDTIVYRNYFDIGVAVGGGRGLVVPVLRSAERMSFAEIELAITDFAERAKNNRLTPNELSGGTFTISNGGIYGSLLSTPILNPPQSGILGMHAIQERAVVRNGQIEARKMMYVALSYDHRIVDGREAVSFLVRVKECIENPTRILLEV